MDNLAHSLIAGGVLVFFFGFCGLLGSLVTGTGEEPKEEPPRQTCEIVPAGEVVDGVVVDDVVINKPEPAYTGTYVTFETAKERAEYRAWLHEQKERTG